MPSNSSLYESLRSFKSKIKKRNFATISHTLDLSGWEKKGDFSYYRILSTASQFVGFADCSILKTTGTSLEELIFFDTETTGLSGGAGNIIFLLGLGRIQTNKFIIEQYFLADFPGEREFLNIIFPRLPEELTYISFNGRAFDRHIIKSRFALHGMHKSLTKQYDLLYPSRRLWKSLIGSCALKDIEENVLNIKRFNDVPGYEVPEIYFQYLKNNNTAQLTRVFAHNYQDILSLSHLLLNIENIYTKPEASVFVDKYTLGQQLLNESAPQAEEVLLMAFKKGNIACGRLLSLHYKRRGDWHKARALWQELYKKNKSSFAALELAKYWEHRAKQCKSALVLVNEVLGLSRPLKQDVKNDLLYRQKRLMRKMGF